MVSSLMNPILLIRSLVSPDYRMQLMTAVGLRGLTIDKLSTAFQVSAQNPMSGLEGRCGLLFRLADALEASPQFFGEDTKRPGNMLGTLFTGFG
jgi:hypothetical protein